MFSIIVTEKGGEQRQQDFDKSEVTIGRVQGNDVILPKGNVSKRHARIVLKDGKFIIVDLKSTNGTYVNGRKITSPLVVKESDKVYIGDFILGVVEGGAAAGASPPAASPPAPSPPAPQPPPPSPSPAPPPVQSSPSPPPPRTPEPPPRPSPPPAASAPPAPARQSSAPRLVGRGAPTSSPPPVAPPAPAPTAAGMPPQRPTANLGASSPPRASSPPPPAPSASPPPPAPAPPAPAPDLLKPTSSGLDAPMPLAQRPTRPRSVESHRTPVIEPLDPKVLKLLDLQAAVLDRLVPKLDLDSIPLERLDDDDLWQRAESSIIDIVESLDSSGDIPGYIDQDQLIKEALNESLGLGPLEDLLADDKIEEIIVDRHDRILVSKAGSLAGAGRGFSSADTFRRAVERLVAPTGHFIDENHPFIDVRLRDGSRVAAAVPPVAVRGACLTLRKPRASSHSLEELIANQSMSAEMGDFLATCVAARKNILICGAPSSGKGTVLAALAAASPAGERIVSVEEVAELSLDRDDWIGLESRPGDGNGLAPVSVETLLRGALRMRPDRLVVADVRGVEALELISAMASSNDGSIASSTGEGAGPALNRLASMAQLADSAMSQAGLRQLVAVAVDVVVHVARYADNQFRIAEISEVLGISGDGFECQQVFCFRGSSTDGGFVSAGVVPTFYAELEARGLPADTSIFH